MFAGRSATEVRPRDEDSCTGKAGVIERVGRRVSLRIKTDIIKGVLTEAIESNAFHESRRNDAVGVDVRAGNEHAPPAHLFDLF